MNSGILLVANRGEIAIRICRAAAEAGLRSVAVYPADDAGSLHVRKADEAVELPGHGVGAYMDAEAIVAAAKGVGASAIHPGYGFLAENAAFARACAQAGLTFVGPTAENLALFGDKQAALELARKVGVPVLQATPAPCTPDEARAFMRDLGAGAAVMIKAVGGGGGRGMRPVHSPDELEQAFARAQSEAESGFGNGALYVERMLPRARHIEVQIAGDGRRVTHFWERDCSVQRRRQKIIEIAPAPALPLALRSKLINAAIALAEAAGYVNLGTVEFLVDMESEAFYFIEANPRLQVEHTVSEEITGIDLVALQLQIAAGATLVSLELDREHVPEPRGHALQMRIGLETLLPDGSVKPGGGTLSAYEPPSGYGVRVDGYAYTGYKTSALYDSLLAKLIVHSATGSAEGMLAKAYRALCEFRIEGAPTNAGLLQALLGEPALVSGACDTRYVETHAARLLASAGDPHPRLFFDNAAPGEPRARRAGASVDASDPLAVLSYGQAQRAEDAGQQRVDEAVAAGEHAVRAPLQGTVVEMSASPGSSVAAGAQLAVIESMKMEHVVSAPCSGVVSAVHVAALDTLWEDQLMLSLLPAETDSVVAQADEEADLDQIRPDLHEVLERRELASDARRAKAVARRRKTGQRTARENVDDLVDPGTFVEYGPLTLAAQRRRRDFEDLLERSPADGLITGVGRVNGEHFDDPHARAAIMAYDYTVFAGTQGVHNHWKTDRLLDIAERGRMPFVLFGEGGGGRPGESDYGGFVGQNTFHHFGQLSGLVPVVGIVSGRCFAGNAALMGCCDVIIATSNTNIGMGGPAMVEGGGLGVFTPEEIGPMSVQVPNGVVDVPVADEGEAVAVARRYLSYFQGRLRDWSAPDQRRLRTVIPENRMRVYEIRNVIQTLADDDSVLEIREAFGRTMVTALARIEGRAVGLLANDPRHLGGAIDSDGADKAARFMQLCDAFDIPIVHLCDTPGIMVGPEVEKTALVRHAARMFVTSNNLSVPFFTVVLRKAYGLGAIAMAGGNFRAPYFTVSWPTGEFGPMGLEGQVKLGYRNELEAIEDPEERRGFYEEMVARSYEEGKALARSTAFGIDDTIDPAETRHWLVNMLASIREQPRDGAKKRPAVDAW